MNFLFPLAGWLGLLALPVVGFYLLKARQRRRPVSTLLFWNQLQPKIENSPFWRKLRRWISLALQLLILGLLVAAVARPAFDWERTAPAATVVVIDPSASLGAGESWERALAGAEAAVARLRLEDEMAVISAEEPPRVLSGWTSSKRELRAALGEVELLAGGTNPRQAIELAESLAALREGARVEIFSDSVWPEEVKGAAVVGGNEDALANAGFSLFAVRRSPESPGDWQLDAEVVVTEGAGDFAGQVELRRDGVPMDRVEVVAKAGEPWRKSWRGSDEGAVRFEVSLGVGAGDRLASDDGAVAELPELSSVRVVVAGAADPFLDAVLDSIPLVEWTRVADPAEGVAEGTDLVIVGPGSEPTVELGVPTLLIDPAGSGFWGERAGTQSGVRITEVADKSALLRHVALGTVAIDEAGRWVPVAGSEVLASSLEEPVIFGRWERKPEWLVVGFDPAKSDFLLRTAFPVLVGNVLQSVREAKGDRDGGAAVLPGAVESRLVPVVEVEAAVVAGRGGWVFPGWWLALFGALAVMVGEWWSFHRRITD